MSESSLTDNRSFYIDKTTADQSEKCQASKLGTAQNPCASPLVEVQISMAKDIGQTPKSPTLIEYTSPQGLVMVKSSSIIVGSGKSVEQTAYITTGSVLYTITIHTGPQGFGQGEQEDWQTVNQILSTFKFTEAITSAKYSCPASGWVDCLPGITAKPECSTEAMTWYKANCPNFQGAAL